MTEQTSRLQIVIDSGDAEKRIKDLKKQLRELGRQSDDTGDNTDDLGRRQRRASDDAGDLGRANDKARKSLDNMAKAAALAGVALAGAVGLGIKQAQKFETAMAEVNKTVDFASSDGLSNLKMELIDLSKTIPLPFEELAAVTASGGQLGVAEKDLLSFTETVAKMAIAFDMSADDAGDAMAKLANVFEIPISEISKLGDAINTLSNNSPAKAAEIVNAMSRVGGLAKQFGLTEDATAALTSTFVALGKPAEIAASAVNSMLITFSTLDMASKSQLIGFEKLGVNIDEFAQRVKVDGKAAIYEFLEAVNKLPQEDRIGVIAPIIGREFGDDVAALAGNMGLLDTQMALVGETADSTKIYIGSMQTEFEKMAATSANATTLFNNRVDAAVATIGEAFLPVLNDLLMQLAPVIDKITVWAQANPELIRQITLVSASVLGSIVSLKLLADGFTAAKSTIDGLKLAYTALSSPMGLTIIALGALLAAGVLVYQNWDEIKQVVSENQGVFTALAVSVSALTVALIAANAPLIALRTLSAIAAVQAGVMTVATSAWSVAAGVAAAATWTFNAALAVLTSPITLVVAAIAGIAYMGYQVVKNWADIRQGLLAEYRKISGAVNTAVATMQAAWDRGVVNTRTAFISIGNAISTTLKALPAKMLQVGRDIVSGLINGIKSGASGVTTAIGNMASSAITKAKSVLDIHSPSREFKKLGLHTADGMAIGIKQGSRRVVSEAELMARQAIKAVEDGIDGLKKRIALFGDNTELSSLMYDIGIGKFKGASQSRIDEYVRQQKALSALESQLKATNAVQARFDKWQDERDKMRSNATDLIKGRFSQFSKDKASSSDNLQGMLSGIEAETPLGKIQAEYDARMAVVEKYEQLHTDMIGVQTEARLAIEQSYMDAKQQLMLSQSEAIFGGLAGMAKGFLGEQSGIYRALYTMQKMYTLSSAVLSSKKAIMDAWANTPGTYFTKALAAGKVVLSTSAITNAISGLAPQGFKAGGYTGNMGVNQIAGAVHGQEYVFDAQATKRIGVDNLNAMRSGKAPVSGGDININVNVDAKGNASVSGDNAKMGRDMANGIKAVVMDTIRKEKRQGGLLYG
ncbi:phage tail tape measure protein [Psychrobacter sp. Arc29]|uniref:phage tail tape measure protein n=1 Tax=Psychrobacter sp. Arc29 TaxID=3046690 RepID=UPI00352F176E